MMLTRRKRPRAPITTSVKSHSSGSGSGTGSGCGGDGSVWSDLPRRLATIIVGVPLIVLILSRSWTYHLFFLGVHFLCCLEWLSMTRRMGHLSSLLTLTFPLSSSEKEDHDGTTTTTTTQTNKIPAPPFSNKLHTNTTHTHAILFIIMSIMIAHAPSPESTMFLLVLSVCVLFLIDFSTNDTATTTIPNAAAPSVQIITILPSFHSSLGLLFISLPLAAFYRSNFQDTCSLLLIVWNCDTGALLVGRLCKSTRGRQQPPPQQQQQQQGILPPPKWLHKISPAKSVEGILGGFLTGVCTTICLPFLWNHIDGTSFSSFSTEDTSSISSTSSSPQFTIALGCSLSLAALLGDLVESAVKRSMHQKDSSHLLPGHGGILDRFDSSFLAILLYDYWKSQY